MPRPVRSAYSIPYGAQYGAIRANGARRHNGTDYHAPPGTPIYGVADGGRVAHIGYNGDQWLGLGHNITIAYPGGVQTLDAHMIARTPLAYGQTVNTNTVIGYVGNTGNAVNASPRGPYNGNHLHHERRHNGALVDPEAVYRLQPAGGGVVPIPDNPTVDEDSIMKIITPYGLPDKGVIGAGIGYAFTDYGDYSHFCNVWGIPKESGNTVVGGPEWTAEQNRAVFNKIISIHRAGGAPVVPTAKQIADAVVAALPKTGAGLTAAQVEAAVKSAMADVEVTATVDAQAIAKAVNEDAANRLRN